MAVTSPGGHHPVSVNLAELRKALRQELAGQRAFKDGDWPLDLKRLQIVALLQDDETKAVLQAAQVAVPEK